MNFKAFTVALVLSASTVFAADPKHTFAIGTNNFLLDGQRFQIRCGVEMCVNLRMNRMIVGAFIPKPLDFERFGSCGEFATIRNRADGLASFLIPSNSTELESRTATVSHI